MNYRLSPSDLTYLFDGCKYCFNLKVKHNISQPSIPMPGIFSIIASCQNTFYSTRRTEKFCSMLPPGIVEHGEKRVQSIPLKFDTSPNTCYIAGRFDLVIKFDDNSYGVIDCKTANPSDLKTKMYGRQLQCYTYALENPAPGKLSLSPISKMGLLYFVPKIFNQHADINQALEGELFWQEVKRDDMGFINFMANVMKILDSDVIYPQTCDHCEYCRKGNACLAGKPESFEEGCTCCPWCSYRLKMKNIDTNETLPLKSPHIDLAPLCPACNSSMNKKNGKYGEFWSCQKFPECKGTRKA